jgi:hypothetical protein
VEMSEADDEGCEPRRRDANPRFAPPAGRIDLAAPELATLDAVLLVALIAYSRFLFLPHKVRDISPLRCGLVPAPSRPLKQLSLPPLFSSF